MLVSFVKNFIITLKDLNLEILQIQTLIYSFFLIFFDNEVF